MKRFLGRHTALVLLLLVLGVGALLSPFVGVAWDEPDNIYAGGVYWNFVTHGFDQRILVSRAMQASYFGGRIFTQEPTIARYPPVPYFVGTVVAVAGERLGLVRTAADIIIVFHLVSVAFLALLVAFVYRWGRLVGLSVGTSVFAAIATWLYPTLFGHGLSDLKDTAQASLFTVSLYYLVKSIAKGHTDWKSLVIGTGIWGLALATKLNAVYVPVIWGLWSVIGDKKNMIGKTYHIVLIICLGVFIAFCVWPYLWVDTLTRVHEVLGYFATVGQGYKILWNGVRYAVGVGTPLWWYPWVAFGLVTPLPVLGLGIIGVWSVLQHAIPGIRVPQFRESRGRFVLLIWLVMPLLRALWPSSAFYDGVRHFLEVIPAVGLLAAVGAESFIRRFRVIGWIGLIGVVAYMGALAVWYFPHNAGYYNALAPDPNVRFDRDIEGLAMKEAVGYLHGRYGPIRIWSLVDGHQSWYYLREGDKYVYTPADANFIIFINKGSHVKASEHASYFAGVPYVLDHMITRGDAVFGWIYKKKL